jgi:galactokinase
LLLELGSQLLIFAPDTVEIINELLDFNPIFVLNSEIFTLSFVLTN